MLFCIFNINQLYIFIFQCIQVTARKEREFEAKLHLEEELDEEKKAEEDYQEFLRREASRLSERGYEPKVLKQVFFFYFNVT